MRHTNIVLKICEKYTTNSSLQISNFNSSFQQRLDASNDYRLEHLTQLKHLKKEFLLVFARSKKNP